MSLKKQALSGVFWSIIQLFGNLLINFGISLILARLLLPSEFGLIAMLGVFIGIGSTLISSGLTSSLIRTPKVDDLDYSTVFHFNLVGSIIIYLVFYFGAPFIAAFYDQESLINILRVYCITFIINAFSAVQSTRLTKMLDFKTQAKISIPSLLLGGIVGVMMAFNGFGVWSLVASAVVQSLAGSMQLWYYSKWKPQWAFDVTKFKHHFNFGVKIMLSSILDTIFSNAYTLIIGKFFAPAQVGFYNRASTLRMLPVTSISSIVTKVSYPLFAAIQDDDVRLKSVYKRIMQMVIFLVAPILILMAVLAEPLFRFLYTEKWLPAVPYFQILAFGAIMTPIHIYNLQILNVKGRSDLFLRLEIIKKILAVVVITISFQFGIFGLLYGSIFSSLASFFINTHYSGKFLNYSAWQQTKDLLPIIALAALAGAVVYFLDNFMVQQLYNDFTRLSTGSVVGVMTFLISAYLLKMNSLEELIDIIKRK
ncbi:teichuronic acid exporter [Flavobacterium sp. PL11]|uniref:lipopolysaccharide biosynthesis protein n=1 Tax=Flavobacterium sp. PL11 TaxID=3071717 RepID=UPI002E0882DD|nr:teichuronic acid exporter [Flavobacterium sp. PL11]